MRKLGFESLSRSTPFRPAQRRFGDTRAGVAALLDEGLTRAQVAARLGVSKATVSYHAKRLGLPGSPACAPLRLGRGPALLRRRPQHQRMPAVLRVHEGGLDERGPGAAPWSPALRPRRLPTCSCRAVHMGAGTSSAA